jgi:hypothetical protein
MKVNQGREETAQQIANIINNCNMLLSLDVSESFGKYILNVQTDQTIIEYKEMSLDGMEWFLSKLKSHLNNKEDIDEIFEELEYLSMPAN